MNETISIMDVINHSSEWDAGDSGYWICRNMTLPGGKKYSLMILTDSLENMSMSATLSYNGLKIFGIGPVKFEDHVIERLTTNLYNVVVNHYNNGTIPYQRSNEIWASIANEVGKGG